MTRASGTVLRVVAAAGLAVDAYVHLALAADYDANTSGLLGEGVLFRIEAAAAIVAALLVLMVRRRATDLAALAVAGSAAAVALLYRYVNVGPVFWLPDMYEPIWFPEKVVATVAELVAVLAAGVLLRARQPTTSV